MHFVMVKLGAPVLPRDRVALFCCAFLVESQRTSFGALWAKATMDDACRVRMVPDGRVDAHLGCLPVFRTPVVCVILCYGFVRLHSGSEIGHSFIVTLVLCCIIRTVAFEVRRFFS